MSTDRIMAGTSVKASPKNDDASKVDDHTMKIKPGEFKGKIRIETNDPDVPLVEVPVQVAFK